MKENLNVINMEGEIKPFSIQKVYRSARNAGASKELSKEVVRKIKKIVYPNIKTLEIFKEIKKILIEKDFKTFLRFDLKEAMKKLGPTGFLFEKYTKSILESMGFKTNINLNIKGKCCSYEIDFLAKKEKEIYVGECKFRNAFDNRVDVNTALINKARFLDLKDGNYLKKYSNFIIKDYLITNGKFTKKAISYSKCAGVNLWGWNYPKGKGLEKIIEEKKLYPITILPSLSKDILEIFISNGKMLIEDVFTIEDFYKKIPSKKINILKKEAETLLNDF